ncbi:hypothetical protein [Pedobacter helvus]|uniref:Lipocalin-like domain-containing protein n=1 Tax=Pedobacter helvus TaxID=2563444 RepID=A0ABW9JCQ0_9SPHI|nr:hypothetical protein [Pedobacter ureilyticus]
MPTSTAISPVASLYLRRSSLAERRFFNHLIKSIMETFKNKFKSIPSSTLAIAVMLFYASCTGITEPPITGTYVNLAGSEASIANDTLRIEPDHGNSYKLFRSTGFRLIGEDGKPGELQHETEIWTAVYDPSTQVMTENRNGKVITFDTSAGMMTVGKRKYKRIKND